MQQVKRKAETMLTFLVLFTLLSPTTGYKNGSSVYLRIGVPVKCGFRELVKVDKDPQTNETTVTGFCADVFRAAVQTLPYEVEYKFIPFVNDKGEPAGTYNDLIDQVYFQKYDAVLGDITISSNRSLYVDFTFPFSDIGVGIVALKQNQKTIWIFLKPLTADLWISGAAFFLFTGFVVWVIERANNDDFQGPSSQQIGTVFLFSFYTLFFAHKEKLLSNLSKFVLLVWLFVVLILTSSYTATLTSMMTVQQIQLNSKDSNIGYQSSFSRAAIRNFDLQNHPLQPLESAEQYAQALSKGSKDGGVSAIVDEIPYIKLFLAQYPKAYSMVGPPIPITNGFGFVFSKGSPIVSDMSRAIEKLREQGQLMQMEDVWFKSQSTFRQDESGGDSNVNPLTFENFRGLFIISGTSSATALVLFSAFLLRRKWHIVSVRVKNSCQHIGERFRSAGVHISKKLFRRPEENNVIHPE